MEEQELKQIWKSSSEAEHITVDINQLIKDFKTESTENSLLEEEI